MLLRSALGGAAGVYGVTEPRVTGNAYKLVTIEDTNLPVSVELHTASCTYAGSVRGFTWGMSVTEHASIDTWLITQSMCLARVYATCGEEKKDESENMPHCINECIMDPQ